ncbi:tetraacyldisaccharide 4'-kinase [Polyangium sp. 15x6]|uniref:tetraacyldisaccharide 4'-kinase n=1 Tax=Polyangium sp. 15x6 TaxID=3042687 RepID=UPI00249B45DD|nr:tetraacyldisaccharide 4'-kinase [Polyangium sp. 15x6]MDI3282699.1 tetraacyldisaccharide 4'-kinase [Polyangium sp. 15x6]
MDSLRARIARRLERGIAPSVPGRALAGAWAAIAAARVARPVTLPEGARIVGVGGAVLGGAGKTPVAIELARALALEGHDVAFIGHGYRARAASARRILPADPVDLVGDDALCAARALAATDTPVFVAKRREGALALAVRSGKTLLVVDGLLQASPRRLDDAVLVLDGASPFGAGVCPPLGDLRAPASALVEAADHVVALGGARSPALPASMVPLASTIDGALDASGRRHDLASLASRRVGLLVAIARPDRLLTALDRERIHPRAALCLADHACFDPGTLDRARDLHLDAWLTTARCATKLPPRLGGAPVLALDHRIDVGPLLARLSFRGSREGVPACARLPAP